ncbi:TIGR02391 family protein [Kitasatospora sp. RB6PN24]|uniref:TIGR02391 family protein n=1 Tax=Kitasatospora humi TaxID=2893891 RepID=UPI001E3C2279|nr:TIGR02391 family protein [Kitasatospora humi]MCC9309110.1 TIGR02391 family protein [Kitasatospora humi]
MLEDQRVKMPTPGGESGEQMLQVIFREFLRTSRWPDFGTVYRLLRREDGDVEAALGELSEDLVKGASAFGHPLPDPGTELQLTLVGMRYCDWSGVVEELIFDLLWYACKVEAEWPASASERPAITSEGFYSEKFDHMASHRAEVEGFVEAFSVALGDDEERSHAKKSFKLVEAALRSAVYQAGVLLHGTQPGFKTIMRQENEHAWRITVDHRIQAFRDVGDIQEWWDRSVALKRKEKRALGCVVGVDGTVMNLNVADLLGRDLYQPPASTVDITTAAPAEQLTLSCTLHPLIAEASADRFRKGLCLDAVLHALKAVEYRVQTLSGSSKIGEDLMGFVLGSIAPRLTVTRSVGGSLPSEQAGMRDLFKGAMTALRNPRAHGPHHPDDPDEAQEMLVLASFLMRRLDLAEASLNTQGAAIGTASP